MLKRKRVMPFLTQGLLFMAAPSTIYLVHTTAYAQSPTPGKEVLYVAAVSSNSLSTNVSYADLLLEPDAPKMSLQPQARNFVQQYLKKNKRDLVFIQKKGEDRLRTIEEVFQKQGLPTELKWLAMVESDFKTTAVSRSGAVGMWQLMPETARNFGLKVSKKTDERKHAYRSTVAAAKYLKSLYGEFDDWLLVIAAYNGGSGRVYNAIKKSGSRNYWALQRFLPAETRGHVQHFISVHYLFEERVSEVTLTRAELRKHSQMISDYLSKKSCETQEEPATDPPVVQTVLMKDEED